MRTALSIFLLLLLLVFAALTGKNNSAILPAALSDYDFINREANVIEYNNNKILQAFYDKWKVEGYSNISIAHFGDSHVQPDYFTSVVRQQLQQLKGNGGRGMIFPYAMAKTYSQSDYKSKFTGNWKTANSIQNPPQIPLGVSGFVAQTIDTAASFSILFTKPQPPGPKFIKVYCNKNPTTYQLTVKSRRQYQTLSFEDASDAYVPYVLFYLPETGDTLEFVLQNKRLNNNLFELYGISIENNAGGVIYHNLGVGGATYSAVLNQQYFTQQFPFLAPDLVILDWGTNDIIYKNKLEADLAGVVVATINKVRNAYPNTLIMLTSVQDMNRKGVNISAAKDFSDLIRTIAFEQSCLYYDWYRVAGGAYSMNKWFNNKLAQPDNIHLSVKGYELKGNLFFEALTKTLQYYNANRDSCCLVLAPPQPNTLPPVQPAYNEMPPPLNPAPPPVPATKDISCRYLVKTGDTLTAIARKYAISVKEIMQWNKLNNEKIMVGQNLLINKKCR
ncbi:LysM peptidoglycan-binding domain-containing protein [Sphingobacteriales bacterium UPWRP_1]|nr:hypothetical protein B6N25_15445 [Sphingobacteriales bacterium TSM_CSS]PSJ72954.1 LysM peptidoglycan-binding domain-containing protein [Sphingobacteriales bacterium UPWRP_1]